MKHSVVADRLVTTLNEVFEVCGYLQAEGGCDGCPLRLTCIDDTSVFEFADSITRNRIEEFLKYSEDYENRMDEQDYIASIADNERKDDVWQGYID